MSKTLAKKKLHEFCTDFRTLTEDDIITEDDKKFYSILHYIVEHVEIVLAKSKTTGKK